MMAKEIVKKYLVDNGYDGLFSPGNCSCRISELMCCGESCEYCEPGYFIPSDSPDFDNDYDYMIGRDKQK